MKDLLSNLKSLNLNNQKRIAAVVIFIVIVILDCLVFIKLQHRAVQNLGPKIEKLKQDLDNLSRDLANMQKTRQANVDKGKHKVRKVASKDEMTLLLQNISDMANKNNVKILQITPAKEIQEAKQASAGLRQKNLALDIICGYHELGKFINDLENAQFYMNIESVKILPRQGELLGQGVSLVVRVYVKE